MGKIYGEDDKFYYEASTPPSIRTESSFGQKQIVLLVALIVFLSAFLGYTFWPHSTAQPGAPSPEIYYQTFGDCLYSSENGGNWTKVYCGPVHGGGGGGSGHFYYIGNLTQRGY